MRIAVVAESFYPAVDATTTTLTATLDALVDSGPDAHDLLLVAPAPGLTSYRGVRIHRVSTVDKVGSQVRGALDAFAPDVVLLPSPGRLGRKALKHARASGTATLVVEHSPLLDVSAEYWRRKIASRASRVVVTSHWMRGRVAELGVDAPVWAPGVDTATFTPALRDQWLHDSWARRGARDEESVVVGYVGGLHQRHGVRRLAALADLPGIRLVVIGEGPERAWLRARLRDATLLGTLQTSDLTVALPSLDVLVHPGEHQTCAHVLREAAASGVPVVAPRAGGAPAVVRHLASGVLHDPRSTPAFLDAVDAVVRDPRRRLLGEHGRAVARGRSWRTAVDELLEQHLRPLAPAAAAVRTAPPT